MRGREQLPCSSGTPPKRGRKIAVDKNKKYAVVHEQNTRCGHADFTMTTQNEIEESDAESSTPSENESG
jgi:hypothetical protein